MFSHATLEHGTFFMYPSSSPFFFNRQHSAQLIAFYFLLFRACHRWPCSPRFKYFLKGGHRCRAMHC